MDLIDRLDEMERLGVVVFSKREIETLFPGAAVRQAVESGDLVKVARGFYLNPTAAARRSPGRILEEVAKALRPGKICYVSLESMLSEYGVISQIPLSHLTVMTTGASGTHDTPYGVIEFTHTKRSRSDVLERSVYLKDRPLRIAKKWAAVQDLLKVGRNTNLIDWDELDDQ